MKTLILTAIALLTASGLVSAQEKEIKKEIKVVEETINSVSSKNVDTKKDVKVISKKVSDDGNTNLITISETKNGKTVEKQINFSDDERIEINKLVDSIIKKSIDGIDLDINGESRIKVLTYPNIENGVWLSEEEGNWIDIDDLKEVEEIHLLNSKRPFLGVILDDEVELKDGIRVINVIEGSAAEKSGVKKDDIILSISNNDVNSLEELVDQLTKKEIGDKIDLQIKRNNELKNLTAVLQSKADSKYNLSNSFQFKTPECCKKSNANCCSHHQRTYTAYMHQSKPRLGIYVEDLDQEMINDLKIKGASGVLITKVLEETTAKKMGLKLNDVITKINGTDINGVASLNEYIGNQKLGDEINVTYYRYGKVKRTTGVLFEFNHSNMNFDWMEIDRE